MLEGAILTSIARTLHIEGTNSGLIPLVVGRHSCQALEHGMGSHLAIGKIFTILICLGILELIVATYTTVGQRHLIGSQLFEVFVSHLAPLAPLAPARAPFFLWAQTKLLRKSMKTVEKNNIGPSSKIDFQSPPPAQEGHIPSQRDRSGKHSSPWRNFDTPLWPCTCPGSPLSSGRW